MERERLEFLERYMGTFCPTGYEEEATAVWREEADKFADRTWIDLHGNAVAVVNEGGSPRVMLSGHADEIGMMVTHIDDNGFLYASCMGGWDTQILPGQRVRIKTDNGFILGVIGRKAIHMMEPEERKKVVRIQDIWIDIGAKDKAEAASLVNLGDPMVLDYGFAELRNGLYVARAFDDRIGAFVVLEAARMLTQMNPNAAVYAVSTVQEEVGARGAKTSCFDIDPKVAIAVDVSHTTDTPSMDGAKKKIGAAEMGGGPIITRGANANPRLFKYLTAAAEANDIPYAVHPWPRGTGTDANTMQLVRSGVATGIIGVPNRYMHSPSEIVHIDDVENCSRLIAHTVAGFDESTSFIPG